ncbi:DUF2490 domain-containing protein [Nibribacter ruber]|uniref:DUF2490 domain-containing protein n=1 Tax=Nibribacter ruber TaxID=2698458 RepID=A0A6P1P323_9BACT|nr:DUF2490 domain-containing protein [Nibribacter ruber]QHL88807.1 DUF2490 domain-containing protein [Nibribacter ruber]
MRNQIIVAVLLMGFSSNLALAQVERKYTTHVQGWYAYKGDHFFTDKWGLNTELHARRARFVDPLQFIAQGGMHYKLSNNVQLTTAYTFTHTHPYSDAPALNHFSEHRITEQLLLKADYGPLLLQHRFRLEQRFIKRPAQENATYLNRARYQVKVTLPLMGSTLEEKEPYVAASNEVFINFGESVQANIFDQNRAYAGLGYKFSKAASLEIGYLHQLVQQSNGINFLSNHTLQVQVGYNLDFRPAAVTP